MTAPLSKGRTVKNRPAAHPPTRGDQLHDCTGIISRWRRKPMLNANRQPANAECTVRRLSISSAFFSIEAESRKFSLDLVFVAFKIR